MHHGQWSHGTPLTLISIVDNQFRLFRLIHVLRPRSPQSQIYNDSEPLTLQISTSGVFVITLHCLTKLFLFYIFLRNLSLLSRAPVSVQRKCDILL